MRATQNRLDVNINYIIILQNKLWIIKITSKRIFKHISQNKKQNILETYNREN